MINFIKAIGDKCYAIAGKLETIDIKVIRNYGICIAVGAILGYLLK